MQTRLGSRVAVALASASGYSSDWTPSLGTSLCRGSGPRNSKKTKKKRKERKRKAFLSARKVLLDTESKTNMESEMKTQRVGVPTGL